MPPTARNFLAAFPDTTSTGTSCRLASSGMTVRSVRGRRSEPQTGHTWSADRSIHPHLRHCFTDPVMPRATISSRTRPF